MPGAPGAEAASTVKQAVQRCRSNPSGPCRSLRKRPEHVLDQSGAALLSHVHHRPSGSANIVEDS